VSYFWSHQAMMEDIHAITYSRLLEEIIENQSERLRLLNAATTIPVIAKMTAYMKAATESDASFAERLLRFVAVEGIFFTGCFCAIYWLAKRGIMKGLTQSNELIARDECLHAEFACLLYTKLTYRLPYTRVHAVIDGAVKIAQEFIEEALKFDLDGMNSRLMSNYIKCQADNILALIAVPGLYKTTHSFRFMDQINLNNQTNFFEGRATEYSKTTSSDQNDFDIATVF
jgi:ribonucleoside-diphosphate reductase beta chain